MKTIVILSIVAWVIIAMTAYPLHKRWIIADRGAWRSDRGRWTNSNMIWAIFVCLVGWPVIWIWYIVVSISEMDVVARFSRWLDSPSMDTSVQEYFKKFFRKCK